MGWWHSQETVYCAFVLWIKIVRNFFLCYPLLTFIFCQIDCLIRATSKNQYSEHICLLNIAECERDCSFRDYQFSFWLLEGLGILQYRLGKRQKLTRVMVNNSTNSISLDDGKRHRRPSDEYTCKGKHHASQHQSRHFWKLLYHSNLLSQL